MTYHNKAAFPGLYRRCRRFALDTVDNYIQSTVGIECGMAGLHFRRRFRKYFRVTMHIFSHLVFPPRTHVFYFGRTCVVGHAGLVIFIIFSCSCALQ